MPVVKKHTGVSKKGNQAAFTKKQVKSSSFSEKIEKANELLSATVFLKKKKPVAAH